MSTAANEIPIVTVIVGNPRRNSRTRQAAERVATRLFDTTAIDLSVVDLADHLCDIFAWPSAEMDALADRVATSDLLVIASPTYKAAYTALTKAFLDRLPARALHGIPVMPVMTGGWEGHALSLDVQLVPVLRELGGSVISRGLYFVTEDMERLDEAVDQAVDEFTAVVRRLAALAPALT